MPAIGKVTQVIGSTFDAEFPEDQLPGIYNALKINASANGTTIKLTGEVQQHLGGGKVRAVALGSTDGLRRGTEVTDTGAPVTVPVGKETLASSTCWGNQSTIAGRLMPPRFGPFIASRLILRI
jgi:F-type H+-transporting ATPase subunit beta